MSTSSWNQIQRVVEVLLPQQYFEHLAVGIIDFKEQSFVSQEWLAHAGIAVKVAHPYYYDLASVSKTLTMGLSYFLEPARFTPQMRLTLEHRGGLPAWGLLPHKGWQEIIQSYPIMESDTLYSDYSALRTMLEFDKSGPSMKDVCQSVWDKETLFWKELPSTANCVVTGSRGHGVICGEIHDPNAWVLDTFCSHTGLFSTVQGLCKTLLNYQQKTAFISQVQAELGKKPAHRFVFAWDKVENPHVTLAGAGCSQGTFGHLGFTGTSVWIDPVKMLGHVILSNATKRGWYADKAALGDIRRAIGELVWSSR